MKRDTKKFALTTLLKRLRELKKEFKGESTRNRHFGLCIIVGDLWFNYKITDKEYEILNNYLIEQRESQDKFWTYRNKVTKSSDQFFWKFGQFAPRERWILEQLSKLN